MKYIIAEILCVAAAVVFIVFSLSLNAKTDKTAVQIADSVKSAASVSELKERDNKFFKKTFDCSPDEFEEFSYYSSDDVMNVSEMLIIKLSDTSDSDGIMNKLDEYISSRYNIFAAYAPEQGEMLKNHILEKQGNVIFMYIGKDEQAAQDAFKEAF